MPHRRISPPDGTTPTALHKPHVTIETIGHFKSHLLRNTRAVEIVLPPGYTAHPERHYKVLYLNDGQDLFHLHLPAILDRLYAQRAIEPIIVVAVHTTTDRLREYGIAGRPNAQGLGNRAKKYTDCLISEIMPAINRRYRTLHGATHTAILGASLGGLSAFDIAWNYPHLFGAVGVFSGSFWWRTDDSSPQAKQDSRILHRLVRASPACPPLRFWFQAGTEDETNDRDGDGVIDAIQDTTELIDELTARGYRTGDDIVYVEVEGGRHDQATWAEVLPEFLTWAFPTFSRLDSTAARRYSRSTERS